MFQRIWSVLNEINLVYINKLFQRKIDLFVSNMMTWLYNATWTAKNRVTSILLNLAPGYLHD
jgi:hypothetical protein